jgi:hypothetical protein
VQLDGRDPVETTANEYSFTGLAAGRHVITIDLVDANHTPIPGSHTVVNFKTYSPGVNNSQQTGALAPPQVYKAKLPLPDGNLAEELPSSAGELPLLSIGQLLTVRDPGFAHQNDVRRTKRPV